VAEWGRGIKAGILAAMVFLALAVVLEFTGMSARYWEALRVAGLNLYIVPWREGPSMALVLSTVISRIVWGTAFGAIFASLSWYLPGTRSAVKGLVLSSLFWILGAVGLIYMNLGWPPHTHLGGGISVLWGGPVSLASIDRALVSIASSLAFGTLVGAIWAKLRAKETAEVRQGRAALLIGSIAGGLVWALSTVPLIGAVVSGGIHSLLADLPWLAIVILLVAGPGAAGWILTLVAWRKTREGESGFTPGLVGGLIMALTGMMLVPGSLAIIGALLSRREPVTASGVAIESRQGVEIDG